MNATRIQQYPKETQEEILDTLKAYSRVQITRESNGAFSVSVCSVISAYDNGSRYIEEIKVEEVYSTEEREANYKETFGYERNF